MIAIVTAVDFIVQIGQQDDLCFKIATLKNMAYFYLANKRVGGYAEPIFSLHGGQAIDIIFEFMSLR